MTMTMTMRKKATMPVCLDDTNDANDADGKSARFACIMTTTTTTNVNNESDGAIAYGCSRFLRGVAEKQGVPVEGIAAAGPLLDKLLGALVEPECVWLRTWFGSRFRVSGLGVKGVAEFRV
eukprot:1134456-Rhodomonas_salina.3